MSVRIPSWVDGARADRRGKVVTARWPDPSHGGLDLGQQNA